MENIEGSSNNLIKLFFKFLSLILSKKNSNGIRPIITEV